MISYKGLIKEYKLAYSSDKWGTAMNVWFAIASELHFRGTDIPDSWAFRPSPMGGDLREPEEYWYDILMEASDYDLLRFGNVLDRYTNFLKRAGKDY